MSVLQRNSVHRTGKEKQAHRKTGQRSGRDGCASSCHVRQWLSNRKSPKAVIWLSHQWKWLCHCQRWGGHGRVVPFPPPFRNTRMDEPKTDKATCPRHLLPMTHPHCTVESINENWYYFTCRECELSFLIELHCLNTERKNTSPQK